MLSMLSGMLSQILGGGAGAVGGGGAAFGQMMPSVTGGVNPFGNVLGAVSNVVGGPASQQGTLSSLPGETLRGIENLAVSDNIIGDTMNLAKPVTNLASNALGDLGLGDLGGMLNPFGSGPDAGPMSAALRAFLPVGLMAGLSAAADARNKRRYGKLAV